MKKNIKFRGLLINNDTRCKNIMKQQVFSTLHTDTHDRLNDTYPCNTSLISLKIPSVCKPSHNMVRSGEASVTRRSWRRLVYLCRQRGGCRGCARMATWRRATSGDHVARRLMCVCHVLACFVSHRSKRALFVGPRVKTGARSCRITDQRLDCRRAVLHSRQCLQTSAGVLNRAHPPQRPGLRVGGALASEAGDMCVRTASSHFRHSCR